MTNTCVLAEVIVLIMILVLVLNLTEEIVLLSNVMEFSAMSAVFVEVMDLVASRIIVHVLQVIMELGVSLPPVKV